MQSRPDAMPPLNPLDLLESLRTPIWLVAPGDESLLLANGAARALAPDGDIGKLRHGSFSAHAHAQLINYLPGLCLGEQVAEVWTVSIDGMPAALSCQLSAFALPGGTGQAILIEGLHHPQTMPAAPQDQGQAMDHEACIHGHCLGENTFYERLFRTNTAPMLLIDPDQDGRIVDANQAAVRFYGYPRESLCRKHTWEINTLGREVLPIMQEIAAWPGGHKPLSFTHKLADGSVRDVQTYAGPVHMQGRRLMLCIIHDITEQKRLETELEQAALHDPLTGLWNRRQFLRQLPDAHARGRRRDHTYSLLMLDADHFKDINDRYGHEAGDRVLIGLAHALRDRIRDSDQVCRWGGEEFVIFLPDTTEAEARTLAEDLRSSIATQSLPPMPPVTVSIGVAEHQPGEEVAALINRADDALYQAKTQGRNRVVCARPHLPGAR